MFAFAKIIALPFLTERELFIVEQYAASYLEVPTAAEILRVTVNVLLSGHGPIATQRTFGGTRLKTIVFRD